MYYHSTSAGSDEDSLRVAFKKCGELAQKGGYSQVGLAVPTKGNLDGIISDVIGEDAAIILQRKNILDLKGMTIHIITEQVKPKSFKGPILAAFTGVDLIKKMVRAGYASDIIFVPWLDEELAEYLILYASQELEYAQ
jgi:hypothetical protein